MSPRTTRLLSVEQDCLNLINEQFDMYPPYKTWHDAFPEVLDKGFSDDDLAGYDSEEDDDFLCEERLSGDDDGESDDLHDSDMEDQSEDDEAFVNDFWRSLG